MPTVINLARNLAALGFPICETEKPYYTGCLERGCLQFGCIQSVTHSTCNGENVSEVVPDLQVQC